MANEGSTKPTELEFELRYIADSPTEDHGGFHPRVVKAAQDALAELLRVRGLLQRRDEDWQGLIQDAIGQFGGPQYKHFNEAMARIWDAKRNFDKVLDLWGDPLDEPTNSETTVSPTSANTKGNAGTSSADKTVEYSSQNPTAPQSSSLVPEGAESADIGKLDTVDESGKVNSAAKGTCPACKRPAGYVIGLINESKVRRDTDDLTESKSSSITYPGSAETGGEKAAQQKYDAVFLKIVRLLAEVHDAFESPAEMSKWGGRRIVQWQQQVKEVVGDARLLFDMLPCEALPSLEQISPQKRRTLDLPEGFLGQRCGQCGALFPDSNFKFCSECGAHLVYAVEAK